MIRILMCDDSPDFLRRVRDSVQQSLTFGAYADLEYDIVTTGDPQKALALATETPIHLAFLDIDMPAVTGFDIAAVFHARSPETKIIFVSGFENMVYTSLRFSPFRFIRKEHLDEELPEALDAALAEFLLASKTILLGSARTSVPVPLRDILYIESRRNYVEAHTVDGDVISHRDTMNHMAEQLAGSRFVRIHNAYLVNLAHVASLQNDLFVLDNREQLRASRTHLPTARQTYLQYFRK